MSRIKSNTPVYVAGFDLGVRPIGDWSMFIILSIFPIPSISLCFPGFSFEPFISLASPLYKISFISVLLPEPETPVIQVNNPKWNFYIYVFQIILHCTFDFNIFFCIALSLLWNKYL